MLINIVATLKTESYFPPVMNRHTSLQQALNEYVQPDNRVAELYHGEKSDILSALANRVGPHGTVYGIDYLNPFSGHPQMSELTIHHPNVRLVNVKLPPFPPSIQELDAIVIREFLYAYDFRPLDGTNCLKMTPDAATNQAISGALRQQGVLILALNSSEQQDRRCRELYERNIQNYPDPFVKVLEGEGVMAFQKA